jgi:single-strand DNA-binding protein
MINNVTLLGRLTAAPELKTTTSGNSVTAFTIAVDRRFQKDGERQTDFINCVAWRNTAEFIAHYFKKGDPIAVTGEIQTRKYKDKSGNNRVAVEVIINDARFVPTKSNDNNGDNSPPPVNNDFTDAGDIDDDLPF